MASKAAIVLNEGIGRRLLNVREAAQYLGLEVDTVYKKARLREVPCVKVGRALRFEVDAFSSGQALAPVVSTLLVDAVILPPVQFLDR